MLSLYRSIFFNRLNVCIRLGNIYVFRKWKSNKMKIELNGDAKEIAEGLSAAVLLENLELSGKRLAMEVNEEILPRSQFDSYIFQPGDKVEIVHAIGGG